MNTLHSTSPRAGELLMRTAKALCVTLGVTFFLAACGGGGNSSSSVINRVYVEGWVRQGFGAAADAAFGKDDFRREYYHYGNPTPSLVVTRHPRATYDFTGQGEISASTVTLRYNGGGYLEANFADDAATINFTEVVINGTSYYSSDPQRLSGAWVTSRISEGYVFTLNTSTDKINVGVYGMNADHIAGAYWGATVESGVRLTNIFGFKGDKR